MLDEHLKSPITQQRLRSGVVAGHIDGFADWLHRHGYEPVTIDGVLRSFAGWTDWMRQAGFTAQSLLAGFEACKAELGTGRQCGMAAVPIASRWRLPCCLSGSSGSKARFHPSPFRHLRPISGRFSERSVHGCASTGD